MKNMYQAPRLNIVYCTVEDILTLSGGLASLGFEETPYIQYPDSDWQKY